MGDGLTGSDLFCKPIYNEKYCEEGFNADKNF